MEYFDIYDKNRNKTGKIIRRGERMNDDEYHLIVHVWLVNSDGKYLLQKRGKTKNGAGLWAATGGNVISGEDTIDCAIRETKEEIGIDITKLEGVVFDSRIYHLNDQNYICDSFLYKCDVDIKDLRFQETEVQNAKWATLSDIEQMLSDGIFIKSILPGLQMVRN